MPCNAQDLINEATAQGYDSLDDHSLRVAILQLICDGGGGGGGGVWGTITGTLSNQIDLQSALDDRLRKDIDDEGFFYDTTDERLGVGVGTNPAAAIHSAGGIPISPPTGYTAALAFTGAVWRDVGVPTSYRYSSIGADGLFSQAISIALAANDFEATFVSEDRSIPGSGARAQDSVANYLVVPLFDSDTTSGLQATFNSVAWVGDVDIGNFAPVAGAGYAGGDVVTYRVYPLYVANAYFDSFVNQTAPMTDVAAFDVQIHIIYNGSLSPPSGYLIQRDVNGGGFNDYIIVAGGNPQIQVDDSTGWTAGSGEPPELTWDSTQTWIAPTGATPSSYYVFRDLNGAGYIERKITLTPSFVDDGTWTADDTSTIPPIRQYRIQHNWTNAAGISGIRLERDSTGTVDIVGTSYSDEGAAFSGPEVFHPTRLPAVRGDGIIFSARGFMVDLDILPVPGLEGPTPGLTTSVTLGDGTVLSFAGGILVLVDPP